MSINGVSKRIKIMQLLAKMPREERRALVRAIGRVSDLLPEKWTTEKWRFSANDVT